MKTSHQLPVPCQPEKELFPSKSLIALTSRAVVGTAGLIGMTLPATAAVLLLVAEPPPGTNQADVDSCVIAATNCPQNLIDFTLFSNSATEFFGYSPEYFYTPGLIGGLNFGFTQFDVAIDSGVSSSQSDTLRTFLVQTNTGSGWITRDSYIEGPTGNIGSPLNNGNGYSDYLLKSVDLSSLVSGAGLRFYAELVLLTGGPESFFVKVVDPTIPTPGSLALLGLGMLGLGWMVRPRKA